jgi:hypothetical protein
MIILKIKMKNNLIFTNNIKMCLYRTKIILIKCFGFLLLFQLCLFLLTFYTVFSNYPLDMRFISAIFISLPLSVMATIILAFILDQRTYDIRRDSLPSLPSSEYSEESPLI